MDASPQPTLSTEGDPLKVLNVIDRLVVGPPRVERDRTTVSYRIERPDFTDSVDLVFKYEQPVLDPGNVQDRNLAAMIGAQVALNYALFCSEITFSGEFDAVDRRFLKRMAELTAREIYVKKFVEPNVFLKAPFAGMPPVRLPSYARATLSFPDIVEGDISWALNTRVRRSCAVLSSGGKDSLLTYGLLNEMGYDVQPLFVNESGRHWFTALNAYRYFSQNVGGTGRVWTNADHVFAQMLRSLPFVRPDFDRVRSDDYPIRLWTVAVFLFAVAPLARSRGVGRLLIGDEHDTTVRRRRGGIPHYDGLYDQSRFFDQEMTRYFLRKKWKVTQFSVLRPLSELLIQKTLAERYPHLLEQQVSCHASSIRDGRVYPCGKCEKCRRIVGMLTALGQNPSDCGYSDTQIKDCLSAIESMPLKQESAGWRHLLWTLLRGGHIESAPRGVSLKERAEILKLRFDRERSPVESVPKDLRKPLHQVLLEHADGAVVRRGRVWLAFDALNDPSLGRPFPFKDTGASGDAPESSSAYRWGELTWPEAEQRLLQTDVALLPVGAIEQHGPHLPLDTDSFDAEYLAHLVAEGCSDPRPLVLPLVPYGVSYHHDEFSGTVSVSNETLGRLIYDIGMGAARNGIAKLVIINGHGGNAPTLNYAAQMINRDAHIFVCVDSGESSDADIYKLVDTPNDVHAGEFETSTSLAARPDLVQLGKAVREVPRFSNRYLDFTAADRVTWYAFTHKISSTGVMGDATRATVEKGREMWRIMVQHLVSFVEELKNMTLDEIYQKRY